MRQIVFVSYAPFRCECYEKSFLRGCLRIYNECKHALFFLLCFPVNKYGAYYKTETNGVEATNTTFTVPPIEHTFLPFQFEAETRVKESTCRCAHQFDARSWQRKALINGNRFHVWKICYVCLNWSDCFLIGCLLVHRQHTDYSERLTIKNHCKSRFGICQEA